MLRFVLIVDDATQEQQNSVTNSLKDKPYGFWHHLSDVWLLVDPNDQQTPASLRDYLKDIVPGATTLVLRIDDKHAWAGFGVPDNFKWVRDDWDVK